MIKMLLYIYKVFIEYDPSSPCIKQLRLGIDRLDLQRLGSKFPLFVHLLRPNASDKLTYKTLVHLLAPTFSEEGSNSLRF